MSFCSPQNESIRRRESLLKTSATTAQYLVFSFNVGEAGKYGEGLPLASTLFVTITRKRIHGVALSSAEQLLLKKDVFSSEVQ